MKLSSHCIDSSVGTSYRQLVKVEHFIPTLAVIVASLLQTQMDRRANLNGFIINIHCNFNYLFIYLFIGFYVPFDAARLFSVQNYFARNNLIFDRKSAHE